MPSCAGVRRPLALAAGESAAKCGSRLEVFNEAFLWAAVAACSLSVIAALARRGSSDWACPLLSAAETAGRCASMPGRGVLVTWRREPNWAAETGRRVFGDETRPGPASRAPSPCIQTAAAGGFEGRHALRHKPGDDAGQHVAGAGSREPWRRVAAMLARPSGGRNHGVRSLQQHDGAGAFGGARSVVRVWSGRDSCCCIAEQPRKLAFVRRQDHLRIVARLDRFKQSVGASAKLVRASASSTGRVWPTARCATISRVAAPTPPPGPITTALSRGSIEQLGEFDRGIDRAHHHCGQRRGIDGQRFAWRGDRHQPGPARNAPRAASRAAPVEARPPETTTHGRAHICGRRSAAPETPAAS